MKDERDQSILKKRQEWEQKVKDYYHPEPKSEEELRELELAKHRDYLRRLRERHERGEI
jgi:lipase chaperone LimK